MYIIDLLSILAGLFLLQSNFVNLAAMNPNIQRAAQAIQEADAILIAAGAGMGVDSGLPDFRGNEGFWKAYPPIAKLGISFSSMADPFWFTKKPMLAWAFYGHRLKLYRETKPHSGFKKLLDLGNKAEFGYFVFTSNVDGHFQKSGYNSDRIYEVHGSINHFQCTHNCTTDIWDASDETLDINMDEFLAAEPHPKCRHCDEIARPNILMFNDYSWNYRRSGEQETRYQEWIQEIIGSQRKLAIIEMGAGSAVPTVRNNSRRMSFIPNATLIRINPREDEVHDKKHISLPMGAVEALDLIMKEMGE